MPINMWPSQERPREKFLNQGAGALSDAELIAILFRTGNRGASAVDLARHLIADCGGLRAVLNADRKTLCAYPGIGLTKFIQLQSALELSRRYLRETLAREQVFESVADTRQYLLSELRDAREEVFALLLLDSQHRLIRFAKVFQGTIDSASVHPRVLVQMALAENAAAVILVHNHPSGAAEPSQADRSITRRLQQAMGLMDIPVLDHMVVGDGHIVSFAERGWL